MIEATFTLFPVPKELDLDPVDAADRDRADELIRYLVRFAATRFDGPMLERVRWVVTRQPDELDGLFLHDCENCAATLRVAHNALRSDPFTSLAIGLIRLDEP